METKMNNTIQRRYKRERKIKNMLWLLLVLAISFVFFSCTSDDLEKECNCVKETYTIDLDHIYDTPADKSNCKEETGTLRLDEFGTLYRYTCK